MRSTRPIRTASSAFHPGCCLICSKPNGESFSSRIKSGFRGIIASMLTLIHSCARSSVTERAPAAVSNSVINARRPAVMQGSMREGKENRWPLPSWRLRPHPALAHSQLGDQRGGFRLASHRSANTRNRVVESLQASGVHQKNRNPHALDSLDRLRFIQRQQCRSRCPDAGLRCAPAMDAEYRQCSASAALQAGRACSR